MIIKKIIWVMIIIQIVIQSCLIEAAQRKCHGREERKEEIIIKSPIENYIYDIETRKVINTNKIVKDVNAGENPMEWATIATADQKGMITVTELDHATAMTYNYEIRKFADYATNTTVALGTVAIGKYKGQIGYEESKIAFMNKEAVANDDYQIHTLDEQTMNIQLKRTITITGGKVKEGQVKNIKNKLIVIQEEQEKDTIVVYAYPTMQKEHTIDLIEKVLIMTQSEDAVFIITKNNIYSCDSTGTLVKIKKINEINMGSIEKTPTSAVYDEHTQQLMIIYGEAGEQKLVAFDIKNTYAIDQTLATYILTTESILLPTMTATNWTLMAPNPMKTSTCTQHGVCEQENTCRCQEGYVGPLCEIEACGGAATAQESCSGNGQCVQGKCQCDRDYRGKYCEQQKCHGETQRYTIAIAENYIRHVNDTNTQQTYTLAYTIETDMAVVGEDSLYAFGETGGTTYLLNISDITNAGALSPSIIIDLGTSVTTLGLILDGTKLSYLYSKVGTIHLDTIDLFTQQSTTHTISPPATIQRNTLVYANKKYVVATTENKLYELSDTFVFTQKKLVTYPVTYVRYLQRLSQFLVAGNSKMDFLSDDSFTEVNSIILDTIVKHKSHDGLTSAMVFEDANNVIFNYAGQTITFNLERHLIVESITENKTSLYTLMTSSSCYTGFCNLDGQCDCAPGRAGETCSNYICYGVPGDVIASCGIGSTCSATDTCTCSQGTLNGNICDNFLCSGKLSNATDVCSGRGSCVYTGICECDNGYYGDNCELTGNHLLGGWGDAHSRIAKGVLSGENVASTKFLTAASISDVYLKSIKNLDLSNSYSSPDPTLDYYYTKNQYYASVFVMSNENKAYFGGYTKNYHHLGMMQEGKVSQYMDFSGMGITGSVENICTGDDFMIFATAEKVYGLGSGARGKLCGHNTTNAPVQITALDGLNLTSLACGTDFFTGFYGNDSFSCGNNVFSQTGNVQRDFFLTPKHNSSALYGASGEDNSLFVYQDDNGVNVVGFGKNTNYMIGGGADTNRIGDRDTLIKLTNFNDQELFTQKAEMDMGYDHAGFIAKGKLYMMGKNTYGQLGTSNTNDLSTATEVSITGVDIPLKLIALGQYFSVIVAADGKIYGTGLASRAGVQTAASMVTSFTRIHSNDFTDPRAFDISASYTGVLVALGCQDNEYICSNCTEQRHCHAQPKLCSGVLYSHNDVCSGHGECVSFENCQCNVSYHGSNCQHPTCFGKNSTDSSVCSGHGTCSSVDTCTCSTGYLGSQCETPLCYGIQAGNGSECSTHGTCIAHNNCNCTGGYSGDTCDTTVCYGLEPTSFYVCSSHGTCNGPDNCNCQANYGGSDCSVYSCHSTTSDNSNACSGHGFCSDIDQCQCEEGFFGTECESWNCDGILYSDPTVCQSRGNCTTDKICSCNAGFTGAYCELSVCYGISSKNPSVCTGHGSCVNVNNCSCQTGYSENDCGQYTCFGISVDDNTTVCHGNGACTSIDTCVCNDQYFGANCSEPKCFGIKHTNEAVCSSHGSCVSGNNCSCDYGYTMTPDCSQPSCFGILDNDTSVCSGHGQCQGPDACSCENGYYGDSCSEYSCFWKHHNAQDVCSSHGSCFAFNQCNCTTGFGGAKCDVVSCYDKDGADATVCSSHGSCTAKDTCTCSSGYAGNQCQHPVCYGKSVANGDTVCNGRGTCEGVNECKCTGNYLTKECGTPICSSNYLQTLTCNNHGTCTSSDNCTCDAGYTGSQCEFSSNFFLDPRKTTSAFINNVDEYMTGAINLRTQKFKFYGTKRTFVKISANAYMTFGNSYSATQFKWNTYVATDPLVMFGNADMDLRGTLAGFNRIYYRQSKKPADLAEINDFSKINTKIRAAYYTHPVYSQFSCSWYFVTTADKIGYYPKRIDFLNSIQVILAVDEAKELSFVLFSIKDTGITRPATEAYVGLMKGGGGTFIDIPLFQDPTSKKSSSLVTGSNVEQPGFYMFPTHNTTINTTEPFIHTCNGTLATDSSVCSASGTCKTKDVCQCEKFHKGQFCEIDCTNQLNFQGDYCQYPACYNKSVISYDTLCSGHGTCVSTDNCNCQANFFGDECNIKQCYGINSDDSNVCSGHGTCQSDGSCSCHAGWSNGTCDVFTCFGNSTTGCANNGNCIGPDTCTNCDAPYYGPSCNVANRYVAKTGTDTGNDCLTESTPCRTIRHVLTKATVNNTIYFEAGEYDLPIKSVYLDKSIHFRAKNANTQVTFKSQKFHSAGIPHFVYYLNVGFKISFTHINLKNIKANIFLWVFQSDNYVSLENMVVNNTNTIVEFTRYVKFYAKDMIVQSSNTNVFKFTAKTIEEGDYATLRNVTFKSISIPTSSSTKGVIYTNNLHKITLDDIHYSLVSSNEASAFSISNAVEVTLKSVYFDNIVASSTSVARISNVGSYIDMDSVTCDTISAPTGCINIETVKDMTLTNFIASDSASTSSGGLYLKGLTGRLTGSSVQCISNSASENGGCLSFESVAFSNITTLSLLRNVALRGSAIYLKDCEQCIFNSITGTGNRCNRNIEFLSGHGNLISVEGTSHISIYNGVFNDNQGVLFLTGKSSMHISESTFENMVDGSLHSLSNAPTGVSTISNCVFKNSTNLFGFGGAFSSFETKSTFIITGSRFEGGSSVNGGGISLVEHFGITIYNCEFVNNAANVNSASAGGGIYFEGVNVTVIDQVLFANNSATYGGAAYLKKLLKTKFFLRYGGALFSNVKFIGNKASDGGAVSVSTENIVTFIQCQFERNIAGKSGGVFNIDGVAFASNLEGAALDNALENSTFGNLLSVEEKSGVTIKSSSFIGNEADVGGAITCFSNGIRLNITNSTFIDNKSNGDGGSLYLLVKSTYISNSVFRGSEAQRGGCAFVLMVLEYNGFFVENTQFIQCQSSDRGGIYLSAAAGMIFRDSGMTNCTADRGAAIVSRSRAIISNSNFESNVARSNGGSLMFVEEGKLSMTNSACKNSVAKLGGCLFVRSELPLQMSHCTFEGNSASYGGSIYFDAADVDMSRTLIFNSSTFSDYASIAGGSFYSQKNAFVDWDTLFIDQQMVVQSNVSAENGYGPKYATNPQRSVLYKVQLKRAQSDQNVTVEFFQLTSNVTLKESLTVFPSQKFDIQYQLRDHYNQVIQSYPGLTLTARITSAHEHSLFAPSLEQTIVDGLISFPNLQIQGDREPRSQLEFFVEGVANPPPTRYVNVTFSLCAPGYRRSTDGTECIECQQGTYSIKPNSSVCYANCDHFKCHGAYTINYNRGYWIDLDDDGKIIALPCPNGKCSGGSYQDVSEGGTSYPTEILKLFTGNSRSSRSILENETDTSIEISTTYATNVFYKGAECSGKSMGIICAQCIENYSEWRGSCVPCVRSNLLQLALYILYFFGIIFYVHASSQNEKDSAAVKILISFTQTTFQTIDFSGWALDQEGEAQFMAILSSFFKSVFNMEIPGFEADTQQTTEDYSSKVAAAENTSFFEGCPFDRPGYWHFSAQLLQHILTLVLILLGFIVTLFIHNLISIIRKRRSPTKKVEVAKYKTMSPTISERSETQSVNEDAVAEEDQKDDKKEDDKEEDDKKEDDKKEDDKKEDEEQLSKKGSYAAFADESSSTASLKKDDDSEKDIIDEIEEGIESKQTTKEKLKVLLKKGLEKLKLFFVPSAFVRTFINMMIFTYQPVANLTVQFLFGCFATNGGSYYLIARSDLKCWVDASEYWVWSILFIPAFLYIVFGPIIGVALLTIFRKHQQKPKFKRYFGTFYAIYKPKYYWFEMVAMLRRVCLILVTVLSQMMSLNWQVEGIQFVLFSFILSINYILVLRYEPYKTESDNSMEKYALFALLFMLSVQEGTSDWSSTIGVYTAVAVTAFMLVILFLYMVKENVIVKRIRSFLDDKIFSKLRARFGKKKNVQEKEKVVDYDHPKVIVDSDSEALDSYADRYSPLKKDSPYESNPDSMSDFISDVPSSMTRPSSKLTKQFPDDLKIDLPPSSNTPLSPSADDNVKDEDSTYQDSISDTDDYVSFRDSTTEMTSKDEQTYDDSASSTVPLKDEKKANEDVKKDADSSKDKDADSAKEKDADSGKDKDDDSPPAFIHSDSSGSIMIPQDLLSISSGSSPNLQTSFSEADRDASTSLSALLKPKLGSTYSSAYILKNCNSFNFMHQLVNDLNSASPLKSKPYRTLLKLNSPSDFLDRLMLSSRKHLGEPPVSSEDILNNSISISQACSFAEFIFKFDAHIHSLKLKKKKKKN